PPPSSLLPPPSSLLPPPGPRCCAFGAPSGTTTNRCAQMDFEGKVFPLTGGYGRYNRIVVVFSWFPNFAVMLNLFSDMFFTHIPENYHCKPDSQLLPSAFMQLSNFTRQGYLNLTIPWVDEAGGFSHCELFKYPPNSSNFSDNAPRERVSCTRGWEYYQVTGLQSNFVTEWDLVCSDYWKIPLQHICFMVGWILGYIFLGTLYDLLCLFPDRKCIRSTDWFCLGLELCDPSHRLMVAMVSGFFGVFAELLLPGLAALCRDWPILQAVATLPLILLLGYWCCGSVFPESPRWLLATLQIPTAKKSLQDFSSRNGTCLHEEVYPGQIVLTGKQFIGTGIQYCFTRNVHSYNTNFYFTYFIRVLTGALACIFICLSVDHLGRRGMLLLSAIITGLSSLLLLALTPCIFFLVSDLRGGLVLVLSVLGLLFSQALAMLSVFFASEVLPTVVRGGCLGLVLAAGCVGMAASSLMELQNNGGYFLHHVIFASFAVLSVLCIMLLPETKRKPLPDSLKEGESQRRPPLFLSHPGRDSLPLLRTRAPLSEYNPDNYSRLVSATRKMLTKDSLPYRIAVPGHDPLLDSDDQRQDKGALGEVVS
uniref:Solute carrier family 22 member 31 n=1 Tax=Neogobius melanostomus TaxID=47308 RepID=A0A8C6S6V2_9GOBI